MEFRIEWNDDRTSFKVLTDNPIEKRVGYARARGDREEMEFSGTTDTVGENVAEQTTNIFGLFVDVLEEAGFRREDMRNVNAQILDVGQENQFDEVFREFWAEVNPTCTLSHVGRILVPGALIEIEGRVKKVGVDLV